MKTGKLSEKKTRHVGKIVACAFSTIEALETVMPTEKNITLKDTRTYDNGGCLVVAEAILLFLASLYPEAPVVIHRIQHGRRVHFATVSGETVFEWNGARSLAETTKVWGGPRKPAKTRPTTAERASLSVYRNEEMSEKLAEMMKNLLEFRNAKKKAR